MSFTIAMKIVAKSQKSIIYLFPQFWCALHILEKLIALVLHKWVHFLIFQNLYIYNLKDIKKHSNVTFV